MQFNLATWPDFPNGLRILLLDGSIKDRQETEVLLTDAHYNVTGCSSAKEAVAALSHPSNTFHLVIADYQALRGETGESLKLAHLLKKSKKTLPFILLSASSTPSDVVQGLNMGAAEFIPKPLAPLKARTLYQHTIRKMMSKTSKDADQSNDESDSNSLEQPRTPSADFGEFHKSCETCSSDSTSNLADVFNFDIDSKDFGLDSFADTSASLLESPACSQAFLLDPPSMDNMLFMSTPPSSQPQSPCPSYSLPNPSAPSPPAPATSSTATLPVLSEPKSLPTPAPVPVPAPCSIPQPAQPQPQAVPAQVPMFPMPQLPGMPMFGMPPMPMMPGMMPNCPFPMMPPFMRPPFMSMPMMGMPPQMMPFGMCPMPMGFNPMMMPPFTMPSMPCQMPQMPQMPAAFHPADAVPINSMPMPSQPLQPQPMAVEPAPSSSAPPSAVNVGGSTEEAPNSSTVSDATETKPLQCGAMPGSALLGEADREGGQSPPLGLQLKKSDSLLDLLTQQLFSPSNSCLSC